MSQTKTVRVSAKHIFLVFKFDHNFLSCSDFPKKNGKVAIVTGGTRGIGYEISRYLVSLDMHVVIGIVLSHT